MNARVHARSQKPRDPIQIHTGARDPGVYVHRIRGSQRFYVSGSQGSESFLCTVSQDSRQIEYPGYRIGECGCAVGRDPMFGNKRSEDQREIHEFRRFDSFRQFKTSSYTRALVSFFTTYSYLDYIANQYVYKYDAMSVDLVPCP